MKDKIILFHFALKAKFLLNVKSLNYSKSFENNF